MRGTRTSCAALTSDLAEYRYIRCRLDQLVYATLGRMQQIMVSHCTRSKARTQLDARRREV